ncbi:MAG: hypothetical protein HZB71_11090 [Betaproteobacteria bacterium]|nr:hypothetical protein [Betaproteobacteria bacterium]
MGKPILTFSERLEERLDKIYDTLSDSNFWALIGWSLLLLGALGFLLWMAVRGFDSAFALRSVVCQGDDSDQKILTIVFTAPFFGISVLGAISEMWQNLEARRQGHPRRWKSFGIFTFLLVALGFVLVQALDC